jgi:hypothetical protein
MCHSPERKTSWLARFRDVPRLASDHGRVARDLSQLLPEGPTPGALKRAASTVADGRPGTSGTLWAVLAIIFMLFSDVSLMVGGLGSGE